MPQRTRHKIMYQKVNCEKNTFTNSIHPGGGGV